MEFHHYLNAAPGALGANLAALVDTAKAISLGATEKGMTVSDYEAFCLAMQLVTLSNSNDLEAKVEEIERRLECIE